MENVVNRRYIPGSAEGVFIESHSISYSQMPAITLDSVKSYFVSISSSRTLSFSQFFSPSSGLAALSWAKIDDDSISHLDLLEKRQCFLTFNEKRVCHLVEGQMQAG